MLNLMILVFSSESHAGVEKILVDNSGNRGGFIFAGAISLWSLWPQDLYPRFPAVFRDLDLTRLTADQNSEYYFGFYRDLNYTLLTSNAQFLDPPVPQTVNGVADAYSQKFFDDFGNSSGDVTAFTAPPFVGEDYLFQKHGVRAAVFGGTPSAKVAQFDGGVKFTPEIFNRPQAVWEYTAEQFFGNL
ncbi:hypothetical protein C8J56DRAFT_1131086 [Mycena floridula]|nr:hypothetical protein C8J56DRAFT_1131086 [Mycena floridula]